MASQPPESTRIKQELNSILRQTTWDHEPDDLKDVVRQLTLVVCKQQRSIEALERRLTPPRSEAFNIPNPSVVLPSLGGLRPGDRVRHKEHPEWEGRISLITGTGYAILNSDNSSFPRGGAVQPCIDLDKV